MRRTAEPIVDIRADVEPRSPEGAPKSTVTPTRRSSAALPEHRVQLAQPRASLAPAPAPAKFQLVSKSPTETVATAGDCLLVIVEKTVSHIGVNAIRRGFEQLESMHAEVGYLSYIEGSEAAGMDATGRQLMADVIRRHTARIGAAAMIVNGDGFRSTVVRSVLTGIHLASRATHPLRVFSAVEPALDWYEENRPRRMLSRVALREALLALHSPAAGALR